MHKAIRPVYYDITTVMSDHISIEVFKDVETPHIDPSIALPAIRYISRLTGGSLQAIDGVKELQVSRKLHAPIITPADTEDFLDTPTDIALILTERDLALEGIAAVLGYSQRNPEKSGGVAVVSTFHTSPEIATLTAAHEIGHLYGLTYGDTQTELHCGDAACIMHTKALFCEIKTHQSSHLSFENQAFCTPCGKQLGRRALFMLRHRSGLFVPPDLR